MIRRWFHEARDVRVTVGDLVDGTDRHPPDVSVRPGRWTPTASRSADLIERVGGRLVIALSATRSTAEVGLSDDARPLTLGYDWAELPGGIAPSSGSFPRNEAGETNRPGA